ncbi:MAG: tetratricopeptide repeat protein [Verrucomicrobiota bacterium]
MLSLVSKTISLLFVTLSLVAVDLSPLLAQQQNEPPRARRFLPFLDDKQQPAQPTYNNPPATPASPAPAASPPVRRAVPIGDPYGTPQPADLNPTPIRKPEIINPATGTPAPATSPPPARLPPPPTSSQGDASFEYANMVYSYKYYDLAVRQYTQYLQENPQNPNAEAAWYRLGESYTKLRDEAKAEECYRTLIRYFPQGDFAGAASYRLADISYRNGDYRTAARNFQIAEGRATQPEIKLSAAYYRARSLEQLGDTRAAVSIFQDLAQETENNPYGAPSMLFLARLSADGNDKQNALEQFQAIKEAATSPAIEAEATYTLASLNSELGDKEKALELYEEVLANDNPANSFRPLAFFALILNQYNAGKYDEVIETYKTGAFDLDDAARAKLLLMVGNSYRNLEKYTDAVQVYNVVEKYYGHTAEGQEAGYRRLLCFHDFGDPNLADYVDFYVSQQQANAPNLPYIDNAQILKAEYLFNQALTLENDGGDPQPLYLAAAGAYASARPQNLSDELKAARFFRQGWSLAESGQARQAIDSLTEFIVSFRDDPKVPNALAKRALAYKSLQDTTSALGDLKRITDDFPESPIAEFAYQQTALIHGQQRNLQEMVNAFTLLLENFPESKGAAEAQFWIGYGNFELENYEQAINPLDAARKADSVEYHDRATPLIIRSHYNLKQVDPLKKEVSDFLEIKSRASVPPQVLAWLGGQLHERGEYGDAERFLAAASDPENPERTEPGVWQTLAKTRIQLEKYDDAINAVDFYLAAAENNAARARALLDKAVALSGLERYSEAVVAAEEALDLEKQGRVNALARIQLGDIAMAQDLPDEAIKHYTIVSQLFVDPEITPLAIDKTANAYEAAGNIIKAKELRTQRQTKFPEYEPATARAAD